MKNFTEGIDSKTGEYFYRENKRRKPPQPPLIGLWFNKPILPQVEGKVEPRHVSEIFKTVEAYHVLVQAGCLPGNRSRAVEKQINMRAEKFVRQYNKEKE